MLRKGNMVSITADSYESRNEALNKDKEHYD